MHARSSQGIRVCTLSFCARRTSPCAVLVFFQPTKILIDLNESFPFAHPVPGAWIGIVNSLVGQAHLGLDIRFVTPRVGVTY